VNAYPAGHIKQIADFAPPEVEAGTGLALQDESGRYIFFLAGTRHNCPDGELFYAGIGGHREPGEDWLACVQREAREEIAAQVEIVPAEITWLLAAGQPAQALFLADRPRPLALYEMIHPPGTPHSGQLYRLIIFQARLVDQPQCPVPDEVQAVLALTPAQVKQGIERRPTLAELLVEGAEVLAVACPMDPQVKLYPLGTAEALARILAETTAPITNYRMRPATAADYTFLYNLKVACLKAYVAATWGWNEAFQQAHFAAQFDPHQSQIITVDGQDAGQLQVEYRPDVIFLAGLYILPGYQGRGLGTAVIRDLLTEAGRRPVALQVLKVNPAGRLYQRLGFRVTGETDTHYQMRHG
jgi:ribosomal protein S18 acetylase RimI-like enzyme/8-oxo-dGTP pyrophosphatase MutT (NUDIX family)